MKLLPFFLVFSVFFSGQCLSDAPVQVYKSRNKLIISNDFEKYGFVTFPINSLNVTFPGTIPEQDEIMIPLRTFLAQGEKRSIAFGLRGIASEEKASLDIQEFRCGNNVLSPEFINVSAIEYGVREGQKYWGKDHYVSMNVPLFLHEVSEIDIKPDYTQQIWLEFSIEKNVKPCVYEGGVYVTPENGLKYFQKITIDVLPIKLDEIPNYFLAVYSYLHIRRDYSFYKEIYTDMKNQGLTSIAIIGDLGENIEYKDSKVSINWSGEGGLETAMTAAVDVGFQNTSILWLMAGKDKGDVYNRCKFLEKSEGFSFSDCYRQVIYQIQSYALENNWPNIIYQPIDEPFNNDGRLGMAKETLLLIKGIKGTSTEINDINNYKYGHLSKTIYEWTDVMTFHGGPFVRYRQNDFEKWTDHVKQLEKDHKKIWFYNLDNTGWHPEPMRFMFGFGLFHAKAKGMLQWSYQVPVEFVFKGNASKVYKFPRYHMLRYPSNYGVKGGHSIAYVGLSHGISDLRYLKTLENMVLKAKKTNNVELKYKAHYLWSSILSDLSKIDYHGVSDVAAQGRWDSRIKKGRKYIVSGNLKLQNGIPINEYESIRGKIADAIQALELNNSVYSQ